MSSPWEILHNRTIQCPSNPLTPFNMEHVQDYLIAKKQSQKLYFDHVQNAKEIKQLDPGQEVLFLSTAESAYTPGMIIDRASTPRGYYIEAQSKQYCRTRQHIRPIQQDIFKSPVPKPKAQLPKPSCIPKPSLSARAHPNTLPQSIHPKPKGLASTAYTISNSCIPRSLCSQQKLPIVC